MPTHLTDESGNLSQVPAPYATQAEMEAGTGTDERALTPARVKQAITANAVALASQAEAEAGTNNTKMMTPLRTSQAIAALAGKKNYPFYAALLTQTGTNAPVITDPYTNVSGLTMTPAYIGVGNFTLTQSGSFINNSVRTRVTFKQLIATVPGFVEAHYTTGFPQHKITLKTFNTSFVAANDILAGYLYVEILDNTL